MKDDSVTKGILMLGGLIGAVIIVGIIVALVYLVKGKIEGATDTMVKQSDTALESIYTDYDGRTITGTELLSCISKFQEDEIYILVEKNGATYYFNYDDSFNKADGTNGILKRADAEVKTAGCYIASSSKFRGEVIKTPDKGICGIKFVLQP